MMGHFVRWCQGVRHAHFASLCAVCSSNTDEWQTIAVIVRRDYLLGQKAHGPVCRELIPHSVGSQWCYRYDTIDIAYPFCLLSGTSTSDRDPRRDS